MLNLRPLMPKEAARQLGVTTDTLRRWGDSGQIGYEMTVGGHRRYDSGEIQRLRGNGNGRPPAEATLASPGLEAGAVELSSRDFPGLRALEFPEREEMAADEPRWRFRMVLADFNEQESLRSTLGLAGMPDAGFSFGGGLQFVDFDCEAPSFGEAVGRMIDAVDGIAGSTRVLSVQRLGNLSSAQVRGVAAEGE